MDYLLSWWQSIDPETLKILSIPFISAFSGWITNWFGMKMAMYPAEFVGLWDPWIGWQGIIPRKTKKVARILVNTSMKRIGSLDEIFQYMEPQKISMHIQQDFVDNAEFYVDELMYEIAPSAWENTPVIIKRRLFNRIRKNKSSFADNAIKDIGQSINGLIDVEDMLVSQFANDPGLLVRIFIEMAQKEINFAINSGFFFGFLFGCVQAWYWSNWPNPWVLPIFGAAIGLGTNWVVLNMIFRPLNPVKISPEINLGFTKIQPIIVQGLFLKEQKANAEAFSRIMTRETLTTSRLFNSMFYGKHGEQARRLLRRKTRSSLEDVISLTAILVAGRASYEAIREKFEDKLISLILLSLENPKLMDEQSQLAQSIFQAKIEDLTPEEFQDMLRPVFKEDEWIALAIGLGLGSFIGLMQFVYIFGGSL